MLDATAPSTATLKSTEPPNQDIETFSERAISDAGSLRSLFLGPDLGAGAGSLEVGGLVSFSSRRNTQSTSIDDGMAPGNEDACKTQPISGLDGQESDRHSRRPWEGIATGPDLVTYCWNLSPSPNLRAHDFVIADDYATGHQSEIILPLQADDPMNFGESAAIWESDEWYTSLNDDETRVDADEGTSFDQCSNRPGSDLGPRPGIISLALTESSGFSSPYYSNDHDRPVEMLMAPYVISKLVLSPPQRRLIFQTST
jgi:hypothetical protein